MKRILVLLFVMISHQLIVDADELSISQYISNAKQFNDIRYGKTERFDEEFYDDCAKLRDIPEKEKGL